jgi:hypothetical protein
VGQKLDLRGQVRALRWRDGASGVLTGALEGTYEAFRCGDEPGGPSSFVLELAGGDLAVEVAVRETGRSPLPPRPPEHPFAGGRNPLDACRSVPAAPGPEGAAAPEGRLALTVLPEASSGIFAGARGEIEVAVPNYWTGGAVVVHTGGGQLWLDYLELRTPRATLQTDLWVDGARSTGRWRGAGGKLRFTLALHHPNVAVGWYTGTFSRGPVTDARHPRRLAETT